MWTLSGIIRLIAGILGLKVDAHSFFFSLGVTLLTFIGLLLAKPAQQNLAIGWGIVANAISFLGAHVLQNGGFKWVKRTQYEQPVWRIHWKNVGKNFCKVLPIPQNILRYSQQKVAKHGSRPSVLAIFCCLIYVIPYLLWLPEQKGYTTDFLVIRLVGGSLCVFIIGQRLLAYLAQALFSGVLASIPALLLTAGSDLGLSAHGWKHCCLVY